MSGEDEGFLNRWSRRKQEAAKQTAEDASTREALNAEQNAPAAASAGVATEPAEEEFDVSKLPPVESIVAGTDIRAFLSKGVPAALTQAALRRAWSADPAIRDHIGLSEYSWDFNAPGQYGFDALDPSVNVQEMVADVFGKVKDVVAESEIEEKSESEASKSEAAEAELQSVELRSGDTQPTASAVADDHAQAHPGDKSAQADAAAQQSDLDGEPTMPLIRRHGGALPT
ncbi:MAG: DUF3306 domain-containing protein [Acidobacteria bacterium]|nr:DUF3306 domain-containing protein [Acidobacteriota bacterium]